MCLACFFAPWVGPAWAADQPVKELAVPLPKFAPRASATTVVCSPSSGVSLRAENEGAAGNPLQTASVVARAVGEPDRAGKQHMRIRFVPAALQISLGSYAGSTMMWGPDYEYSIQGDAPEDFVAIRKGSGEIGMLQTLVLNRVTGTAILTLAVGSLPSGAHPYVSSTFFTCEPQRQP
jgi:hypothetical protein